jgi:hypothetical protein
VASGCACTDHTGRRSCSITSTAHAADEATTRQPGGVTVTASRWVTTSGTARSAHRREPRSATSRAPFSLWWSVCRNPTAPPPSRARSWWP